MGAYDFNFDLPPDLSYAPSPDRVKALEALMPGERFSFAPVVTDRAAWTPWQSDPFGAMILKTARELAAQPFPDYTDARYLECLEKEDVTQMNAVIPIVRKRQVAFLLAEAIYDQGEFIKVIGEDARQLAALRTWIHPGNDLKRLNYDLKTVEPDLVVMHFVSNLAQTDFVLGPRLSADVRTLIREQCDRRVFAPLRQRLESGRDLYWWIDVKHNWNAVCLACCAESAAALQPSTQERAWWMAFAESLVKNFRDGFNDDGVCTEGVGYWSYGFMHYVSLAELLRMATNNAIDLLDEPKAARVARFPDHVELQPKVFPTFADCALDVQPVLWTRLWIENRRGTSTQALEPMPAGTDAFAGMGLQFAAEVYLWMFRTRDPRKPQRRAAPAGLRNWFDASSLLISRSASTAPRRLSASFLGGNNGTNHNHNDLGTFTIVLDGRTLVVDPGAEIYSFRTFSTHRYDSALLNSFGHPVPRVAGKLQEAGPEWRTKVLVKEFTDATDRVVFDLRTAYDVPTLRKLEREFIFDRRGEGSVTIIDRVEFISPAAFESALITLGKVAVDGARVRLTDGDSVLIAEVSIEGAPLETKVEVIDQAPRPTRVALRCGREVLQATVKTVFRPA
ncbi:MAG: Heparinase [Verrucomicrobia bacterium]|nr:Heparinase [Verrucomicrobiota bacterium]